MANDRGMSVNYFLRFAAEGKVDKAALERLEVHERNSPYMSQHVDSGWIFIHGAWYQARTVCSGLKD